MSRPFSLAGLLRLRHLQQDQAAGDLAAANARLRATATRIDETRAALEHLPLNPTGADTLYAIAAARASSRSMLAELVALDGVAQQAAAAAKADFEAKKAASASLEKLEGRHGAAEAAEDLHAQQTVIDEIASTGWHRRQGEQRAQTGTSQAGTPARGNTTGERT
ncbi:flagellar export protein FliJ [Cryobacterium soli]|uniref:flagellar export protein FliJ n=1 Tax=Cryobacterium soli TaxID=2220095 RepID=UPI0015E899D2|nr:flagellar export protein FliJ [Cryobacterium soli]